MSSDHQDISADMTIAVLLQNFPQAIPVFLRFHMACVGCSMSAFDTLAEAAQNYAMGEDFLLAEIRAVLPGDSAR